MVLVVLGVAVAAIVVTAGWVERASEAPRFSLALLVVMGMGAVTLLAVGVGTLASTGSDGSTPAEPADYRHTYPLFGLLALALLGALVARGFGVPATFGQFGYYRGGAPAEARQVRPPRFVGKEACRECHDFQAGLHDKDVHRTVQCEDCHGPGDVHAKADEKTGNIVLPKNKDNCLVCHRQLLARPGPFAQIRWRDHFDFVGVREDKVAQTECVECHDPHEPLFLQKPLKEARLHPLIHRCRDCHLGRTDEKKKRPEEHPAIFECSYCHKAIAKDFDTNVHSDVKCTTCHLFLRESDFAGRIVLNRDPRFCLLCHARREFRDGKDAKGNPIPDERPHLIEWPAHLKAVEAGPEYTSETPCVKCHAAQLHGDLPHSNLDHKEDAHE